MIGRPVLTLNRMASYTSAHARTGGLMTPSDLYLSNFFIDVTW